MKTARREPPHTPPNTRIGESPIQPLTPSRACDYLTAHPTPPPPPRVANQKKASGPNPKSPNRKKLVLKDPNATQQAASRHPRQVQTNSKSTHQQPLHRKLTPSPSLQHPFTNPRPHPQKPTHPSPSSSKSPTAAPSAPHCPRRRAAQRHPSGRAIRAAAAHGAGPGRRDGSAGGGDAVVHGAESGARAA